MQRAMRGWQCLEGCKADSRRPIDTLKLAGIMAALEGICSSLDEVRPFRAAFSLAFYGVLRVSDLVAKNKKDRKGGLQCKDIQWPNGSLAITIPQAKTDQMGRGDHILLHQATGSSCCLLSNLESFLGHRGVYGWPSFVAFGWDTFN